MYKAYNVNNFRQIAQVQAHLTEADMEAIEVVGCVLPFKVNNYVVDELIDWENWRNDSMYALTFPSRGMLQPAHFEQVRQALREKWPKAALKELCDSIRMELNPNPAGQMDLNLAHMGEVKLAGIQHKYEQTILFFPSQGQTCHAYCTFCFRWPQFSGMEELKFGMNETSLLVEYLKAHPNVTDILITGGDPMIMRTKILESYILPLLSEDLPHLQSIRIGTKSLSYWPYRFLTDKDADELIALFEKVYQAGKHLALMAHFNHPKELEPEVAKAAIRRIRQTGAEIRTQSPIMRYVNDSPEIWREMWKKQVQLGLVPYYMFIARDTGAQDYFAVPLVRSWEIFKKAYQSVSGLARTVRGPSMSMSDGKIQVAGVTNVAGEKVFVLNFIQARNADWVQIPFFAKYDENAIWVDDLQPAFNEQRFFFEQIIVDNPYLVNSIV